MKILFIGGTGNISTSVSKLCVDQGIELYLLNRGKSRSSINGTKQIIADISDYEMCSNLLSNHFWDVVVNWIAFTKEDIIRDVKLFSGKTKQYIFISSASAYEKPPKSPFITEETHLANPFWEYSHNKIRCEKLLNNEFNENKFPVTIVRPSLTYDTVIPLPIGAWTEYTVIERMKQGKKIIVHGDGTSLWTITHARDFAKGFIGLIGNERAIGESFHITSDEVLTWNQIYQMVAGAINAEANIIHIPTDFISKYSRRLYESLWGDKAHSVIFDNSKIKDFVPNFNANISFEEGIKETISWFEEDETRKVISEESNLMIDRIISDYEKTFKNN